MINNLSLPLVSKNGKNVVDIVDCFRNFFEPEHLEDLLTCDHCKQKTTTFKYMKIWVFPKVLLLHLKRYRAEGFYCQRMMINNTMVEISDNLVFQSLRNKTTIKYKLKCIVNHFGSNPNSGHYTTVTLFNNEWVNIDDANIYKADKQIFLQVLRHTFWFMKWLYKTL